MDFSFPSFTRASTDNLAHTQPPQKSLLELVIEAKGRLGLVPQREAPARHPGASSSRAAAFGDFSDSDEEGEDGAEGGAAGRGDAVLTTRTSWVPPTHLLDYFFSSEFLSVFLTLHGITASRPATALVPPLLCVRDAQLHPRVAQGLCAALRAASTAAIAGPASDGGHGSAPLHQRGGFHGGRGGGRDFGRGGGGRGERGGGGGWGGVAGPAYAAAMPMPDSFSVFPFSAASGGPEDELGAGGVRNGHAPDAAPDDGEAAGRTLLRGLQQIALPALLLGDHVLMSGPRGIGKRTAALLSAGTNALAAAAAADAAAVAAEDAKQTEMDDGRTAQAADAAEVGEAAKQEHPDNSADATPSPAGGALETFIKAEVKGEEAGAERASAVDAAATEGAEAPSAASTSPTSLPSTPPPRALFVVASHPELLAAARWLGTVFGPDAFAAYTFRKDDCALRPLEAEDETLLPPSRPPPSVPPPQLPFASAPVLPPVAGDAGGSAPRFLMPPSTAVLPVFQTPMPLPPLDAAPRRYVGPPKPPILTDASSAVDPTAPPVLEEREGDATSCSTGGPALAELAALVQDAALPSTAAGVAVEGIERDAEDVAATASRKRSRHGREGSDSDGDADRRARRRRRDERTSDRHHRRSDRSRHDHRREEGGSSRSRHRSDKNPRDADANAQVDGGRGTEGGDATAKEQADRDAAERRAHRCTHEGHRSSSSRHDDSRHHRSSGRSSSRRDHRRHHHTSSGSSRHRSHRRRSSDERHARHRSSRHRSRYSDGDDDDSDDSRSSSAASSPPSSRASSRPAPTTASAADLNAATGAVLTSVLGDEVVPPSAEELRALALDSLGVLPDTPALADGEPVFSSTDAHAQTGAADAAATRAVALVGGAPAATSSVPSAPAVLRQRVPVLLTTYHALETAMALVQGKASALPPLENVRVALFGNLERALMPPLKDAFPHAWWLSLVNAVDVECQFIVTADRSAAEVRGFLDSTVLPDAGERLVHFDQRDASVWAMMHVDASPVAVQAPAQGGEGRGDAASARGGGGGSGGGGRPRLSGMDIDAAKVAHLYSLIVDHASLRGERPRVVVVCSARREQTLVAQQLHGLISDQQEGGNGAVFLRVTESPEVFRAAGAAVLVVTDTQLADMRVLRDLHQCTEVDLIVHFSLPRQVMQQLDKSVVIDVLAHRGRCILGHSKPFSARRWWRTTAAAGDGAEAPAGGSGVGGGAAEFAPAKVMSLLLLTEHNMNGRVGACVLEALSEVNEP